MRTLRILIFTKNMLCEQRLQEQLQRLNHEVFVSNYFFKDAQYQLLAEKIMDYFPFVLFSETVTDGEMLRLLPMIELQRQIILRKHESDLEQEYQKYWSNKGVKGWIYSNANIEELREQLSKIMEKEQLEKKSQITREKCGLTMLQLKQQPLVQRNRVIKISDCKFANNEQRLLEVLINKKKELCSREEICMLLWNSEPTNSKLAQLSCLIKKMKKRFKDVDIHEELIQTKWGKGYMLTDYFYEYFMADAFDERKKVVTD